MPARFFSLRQRTAVGPAFKKEQLVPAALVWHLPDRLAHAIHWRRSCWVGKKDPPLFQAVLPQASQQQIFTRRL